MMHRTLIIILFVVLSYVTCFGQRSFKGLTPGQSTKDDVEKVLGQPINKLSETLYEYQPLEYNDVYNTKPRTAKIFVQYSKGSFVMDRIEWVSPSPEFYLDNADFLRVINLNLPDWDKTIVAVKDKWVTYYAGSYSVVTTSCPGGSGLCRIAYYSKELFESAVSTLKKP